MMPGYDVMIEIRKDLFIGNEYDALDVLNNPEWAIIHACKDPYHRRMLGYKTPGAPKDHPEYLFGVRNNRLILNLVDSDDPGYIQKPIIDESIKFINSKLSEGYKVLVHCNQGKSRSAGIGMLYLASIGMFKGLNFQEAERKYVSIYPPCSMSLGMRGYIMRNWADNALCE